jgi:hypothetical protein
MEPNARPLPVELQDMRTEVDVTPGLKTLATSCPLIEIRGVDCSPVIPVESVKSAPAVVASASALLKAYPGSSAMI